MRSVIMLMILPNQIAARSITKGQRNDGESDEHSFELMADSIELPPKVSAKRQSCGPRQTRNLSTRAHFYDLLINILSIMQSSTKNDIRRARERELRHQAIV
jgi:hypothetical protein